MLASLFLYLCSPCCTTLAAQPLDFSFGIIGQTIKTANDDAPLARAIADSDADNLAFVVANGFKRTEEACTDSLYLHRLDLLAGAKNGLIVSPTADDWAECKNANGRNAAVERLSRLRELFFTDEFSLGASKLPLIRQSNVPKFRSYVENARWEVGSVLFATINLPADNNHYRTEAGRNSEFEDRLIANRDWLKHVFAIAAIDQMAGIVLVCDADPLQKPAAQHLFDGNAKRDGFAEIRQQLLALAAKFPEAVLLIHNRSDLRNARAGIIEWHGNLGNLGLGSDWTKVNVKPGASRLFSVTGNSTAQSRGD